MWFLIFINLLGTIAFLIYYWNQRNFSYWRKRNIPYMKPYPIIGNYKDILTFKTSISQYFTDVYNRSDMEHESVVGIYAVHQPGLLIRDLNLIKAVLTENFDNFHDRYGQCDMKRDPIGAKSLFFSKYKLWKEMRHKVKPVYTSGKAKQMFPLMIEIAKQLEEHLARKGDRFTIEVKELSSLYTVDLIATIAFGILPRSIENPNGKFNVVTRTFFDYSWRQSLNLSIAFLFPKLVSALRVKVVPDVLTNFIRTSMSHIMKERVIAKKERGDLIDVLIKLKAEALANGEQRDDDFYAQGFNFLVAGYETSATTMSFALFELSKHPAVQKRLREEIKAALQNDNELSYEKINSLEYLTMVVNEVLRLYPILGFLDRKHNCENGKEGFSLRPHYDYVLPEGMPVYIPVFALHRESKYWTKPNDFDPERFSAQNRDNIIPFTYMPFGYGARNCIGSHLGLLQTKIGLFHYLKNYKINLSSQMNDSVSFEPKSFILQHKGPINIDFERDVLK